MKNLKQLLPLLLAAGVMHSQAATTRYTVTGAQMKFDLAFVSGFDAITPVTPEGGNPATKLGEQRKQVFISAARYLAAHFASAKNIGVTINFDSSLGCTATEAQLGSASPVNWYSPSSLEVNAKLLPDTFYPSPLFAAAGGQQNPVIDAVFNANIGTSGCLSGSTWYYGFDTPPAGKISLLQTVIHEFSHALGIASQLNQATGQFTNNLPDIYSSKLGSNGTEFRYLSAAQRLSAITSDNNLLWQAAAANNAAADFSSGVNNGKLMLHAPAGGDDGLAVTHLHNSLAATQLLAANSSAPLTADVLGISAYMLEDLGWSSAHYNNLAPQLNPIPNEDNLSAAEDTVFSLFLDISDANLSTGFEQTYFDVLSCPAAYTCVFSGNELRVTPPANRFENVAVSIRISDGNFAYVDKTLHIPFAAVNDLPVFPTKFTTRYQALLHGDKNITLLGSDVELDDLYFCVADSSAGLAGNINISDNVLTLSDVQADGTVTVEIRDVANCSPSNITYNSVTLEIDAFDPITMGNELDNNAVLQAGLSSVPLTISGGSGTYQYSATLYDNSVNVISISDGVAHFVLPASGAFAGTYTITIRDKVYSENIFTLTAYRPLRLNWNADKYLAGSTGTLMVEGAKPGDLITLNNPDNLLILNSGGSDPLQATASSNTNTFNAASFSVQASTANSAVSTQIDATASVGVSGNSVRLIVPTRTQQLSVTDEAGNTLSPSQLNLIEDANVTAFDLPLTYNEDSTGHYTFVLPADTNTYRARVSASGYSTRAVDFVDGNSNTTLALRLIELPMTIQLRINAASALSVSGSTVTLHLANGSSRPLAISAQDGELWVNETLDLNLETPQSLSISATGMQSQSIVIDSSINSLIRTITLLTTPEVVEELDPQASSLHWLMLLLLLPLLFRRRT